MHSARITTREARPAACQAFECVERRGVGHPDSICDGIAQAISSTLANENHSHISVSLLPGVSHSAFGGGRIESPMQIIVVQDQENREHTEKSHESQSSYDHRLFTNAAHDWIRRHLRHVDPARHVVIEIALATDAKNFRNGDPRHPSRSEHNDKKKDTPHHKALVISYAPLTETEQLVLEAERWLNSPSTKSEHPETGEDIRLLAIRQGTSLRITATVMMVDRHVRSMASYLEHKTSLETKLRERLEAELIDIHHLIVEVNPASTHMSVLGTSAESRSGGQSGRSPSAEGLTSITRPSGLGMVNGDAWSFGEAARLRSFARSLATKIESHHDEVEEACVTISTPDAKSTLTSTVDSLLDAPPLEVTIALTLREGAQLAEIESPIQRGVDDQIASFMANRSYKFPSQGAAANALSAAKELSTRAIWANRPIRRSQTLQSDSPWGVYW